MKSKRTYVFSHISLGCMMLHPPFFSNLMPTEYDNNKNVCGKTIKKSVHFEPQGAAEVLSADGF